MGLFKKKKVIKTEDNESTEKLKDATYAVVLKDKLGSTTRTIKEFEAVRWLDEDDHVVYLKNDALKFLEIFPGDMKDFLHYTESEVDKQIKEFKIKLRNERRKGNDDKEEINDKNIEFELLKLEAKKRSFKFSKNSSYLTFGNEAKPTFYFLREGSTFFPFKWDADTKSVYTPSDNKKKKASISLRNKQNKYKTTDNIQKLSLMMLVVAVIGMCVSGFILFKAFSMYDSSKIADVQRSCLEDMSSATNSIEKSASNINKITVDLNKQLNKPQTVIQGVVPE